MLRHRETDIYEMLTSTNCNSGDFFHPLQMVVKRNARHLGFDLWPVLWTRKWTGHRYLEGSHHSYLYHAILHHCHQSQLHAMPFFSLNTLYISDELDQMRGGYLRCSVGSSSLPSPVLPMPPVTELGWFTLVCGSGEGSENVVGDACEEEGGFLEALNVSKSRAGGPFATGMSSSCRFLVDSAARFNSIACLCERIGSAVFRGSTSLLDAVTVRFGRHGNGALLFPDGDMVDSDSELCTQQKLVEERTRMFESIAALQCSTVFMLAVHGSNHIIFVRQ